MSQNQIHKATVHCGNELAPDGELLRGPFLAIHQWHLAPDLAESPHGNPIPTVSP